MARGQLRVYLGSAPGVGKTYRMLDEGFRRRERGTDVVIGYVETHGRPRTDAQVRDLEIVPRESHEYRGATIEEMDVTAVLARKPEVVLVDELAHTNAPGSQHEKRWEDVEAILDAGIDVITTVNIQHLESVNDVVQKITGITQQETVPDAVVRRAEQIELVDVTPEALRRRMAHGNIYGPDKIDASLSNYFRVGNLSALRELALLWLADRVEDAIQRYQDDHDIAETWETRERLIVGVEGSAADEILLRRAARIASRTGAEIIAVHVVPADSVHRERRDTSLAQELVGEFEGKYQEIVDDDAATALVAFARSERGTQIILGASRSRRWYRPFGGVIQNVLRHTPDLDVHVISVGTEGPVHVHPRRQKGSTTWQHQVLGVLGGAVALPLLTFIMTEFRSSLSLSTDFLFYLVIVLGLATFGGVAVGIVMAFAAFGLENYYLVAPFHKLSIARPDNAVSLIAFLVFAVSASFLVSRFARRTYEADRARAEAEILAKAVVTADASHEALLPLLDSLRAVFDATSVAVIKLRDGTWQTDVVSGDALGDLESVTKFPIDENYALALEGVSLDGEDQQLVSAFAGRVANGLRITRSVKEAEQLRELADAEAKRTGLMRAVSTDLSGSLSAIQYKVTAMLDGGVTAPARIQRERLLSIESEVQRLARVVNNLVDLGRLESGAVTPHVASVTARSLVDQAIASSTFGGCNIDVDISDDLPRLGVDPNLAQRVIEITVANACRFSDGERPVRITAGVTQDVVELLVIDRGLGIKPARRATMFDPISRAEASNAIHLGLTVVRRYMELLGGEVRLEDTPGGGLTAVFEFPITP